MVGCFGNLSGTYWIIVIRPQLSRTATTVKRSTSNRLALTILNRAMRQKVSFVVIWQKQEMVRCKHVQTRRACSVDAEPVLKWVLAWCNALTTNGRDG